MAENKTEKFRLKLFKKFLRKADLKELLSEVLNGKGGHLAMGDFYLASYPESVLNRFEKDKLEWIKKHVNDCRECANTLRDIQMNDLSINMLHLLPKELAEKMLKRDRSEKIPDKLWEKIKKSAKED